MEEERTVLSPLFLDHLIHKLAVVAAAFKHGKKEEESVLIIIGVGAKNVNSRYNSNRISEAVKHLAAVFNINSEKIVVGISPTSSDKLGYLKFYVNGELVDEIVTRGKGGVCLDAGN
jgi:hypothetical protein